MLLKNFGASFGWKIPGMGAVSGVVWLAILGMAMKERKLSMWLVVVGGGLNLWQRFSQGYVIDYWKIPGINLYNNLNDWLIFIGFGWYLGEKLWRHK